MLKFCYYSSLYILVDFIFSIILNSYDYNNYFYGQISTNVQWGLTIVMNKPLVITHLDRTHVLVTLVGLVEEKIVLVCESNVSFFNMRICVIIFFTTDKL